MLIWNLLRQEHTQIRYPFRWTTGNVFHQHPGAIDGQLTALGRFV